MNHLKKASIACLLAGFLLVGFDARCQDSYVTVKLYEPINKKGEIVLSYGGGKSERIPIEELNSDHHEINCSKLTDVFNRLAKEGFKLVGTAGSSHGNPASVLHVETFVFVKED